jgi:hypothetical protein
MALPEILITDFTGPTKIVSNQFKQETLETYIADFRAEYLRRIVGDAAFIDISAQSRQKWTDLLNGVNYTDSEGKRLIYGGLVKPLILFIYFEFVRDNFTPTQVGTVKGAGVNSDRSSDLEVVELARSRYNRAVAMVNNTLPDFLEANADFSEDVTGAIDNADNTYTLSIASTKYLEVGDFVTIDTAEYEVTALTGNTNITIDALQVGLDFSAAIVDWDPYGEVTFCEMEVVGVL